MSDIVELPDEIDLRAHSSKLTWGVPGGVYEHVRERAPDKITAIVLHQTACLMGEKPDRYLNTGAHYVCTRGGQRIWLHDEDQRIVSADGFNARGVSIECDGIYPGDDSTPALALAMTWDDPTTKIREQPMVPTSALVAAGRETCRAIIRRTAARGGRIKFLFAHRQSSETRRDDPGAALWRLVAMPIIEEFGLNETVVDPVNPKRNFDAITFKVDDGRTIPACWNPAFRGNRY